jgi:hypothetical protein
MEFIQLHRVCGSRNNVEPIIFNISTINTIAKAQSNYEYDTLIVSGNTKYMIQEKYETIVDILENRTNSTKVYSTVTLSNKTEEGDNKL